MNTDDLRRLAVRAEDVDDRQAIQLSALHSRIRTARRRRAGAGAAAAAAAVIAVVAGGAAITGSSERTQEPVDQLTPQPTPTEAVDEIAGQKTIIADIGPGDIRGWELRGSLTNADPGFEGAADLALTVEAGGLYGSQSQIVQFCNGDADTWWVLTLDLGGVDGQHNPDGSMQDGTRGMYGRCSPGDPTAVPPARGDIGPWQRDEAVRSSPMRMFVTDELPAAARQCIAGTDTYGCLATHAVEPLEDADATFGFGVYEHLEAPIVMTVPNGRFQALSIAHGVEYLVDRAFIADPGEPRLGVQLPESDRSRLVAMYQLETSAMEDCVGRLRHGVPLNAEEEQAQLDEVNRRCLVDLELRIDGKVADFDGQIVVPPGAHEVTVEVVRNDPRNIRYSLVIWKERS